MSNLLLEAQEMLHLIHTTTTQNSEWGFWSIFTYFKLPKTLSFRPYKILSKNRFWLNMLLPQRVQNLTTTLENPNIKTKFFPCDFQVYKIEFNLPYRQPYNLESPNHKSTPLPLTSDLSLSAGPLSFTP